MRKIRLWLLITIACLGRASAGSAQTNQAETGPTAGLRQQAVVPILSKIGTERGICVVLGDAKCELALKLATQSELLIYVQLPRGEDVETARKLIDDAGFYGTRIFIETGPLTHLHLADNLADALIAVGPTRLGEGPSRSWAAVVSETEVLRVLRPEGKALLGDKVLIKPFPEGVDDWSHPYHGPDNNPQSQDRVILAPYLTQFLADPRYAPVPQIAVASAGRVFKAFGHVAFKKREEPFLNKLVAFNGYNGTILWERDLTAGIMVHRNTMIATPTTLYLGDDESCKLIDAATGRLKDQIIPPVDIAGGTFWKWMGMENGVLYALIGEQEQKDPTMQWRLEQHGWPWNPISKGFNQPDAIKDSEKAYAAHPWGFGRDVLAIDPKTKKVLWSYHADEPVDSRAMCMADGRIYIFRFGAYLASLDAKTGEIIWRKTPSDAPELFDALGRYMNRQGASFNWRTTCYLKCSDKALYFAGPQVGKLVAVSAKNGDVLWANDYGNFQLVLRDEGLYGISGQNDLGSLSKKFDPLTGEVLAELETGRRSCTRPTGTLDAIFYRAREGSTRFDLASSHQQLVSPMRPPCHDGVTIANGLLYWWPSVCDCQLTLYGITCLAPAGDFNFRPQAADAERLEKAGVAGLTEVASLPESPNDWPTFRADNTCSAATRAVIPERTELLWQFEPKVKINSIEPWPPAGEPLATAPVAVGPLVFISGPDGIVRALDAASGKLRWKAYTGGPVRFPPTIWKGRALIGSGDGWVYAFEAQTGRLLWRFRTAPAERKIPVYGSLVSTWPAASGVIVEDGIAYVAAGIVNYDGTYVYALDAATGRIKWQNNSSGHLNAQARSGVGVQGHLLLHDGRLYLAGGNAVSPAIYDTKDGKCLNDPDMVQRLTQNNVLLSQSPRGWELSLLGNQVVACGKPFYAHPKYDVFDPTVFNRVFLTSSAGLASAKAPAVAGRDVVWVSNQKSKQILCFDNIDRNFFIKSQSTANPQNHPATPGLIKPASGGLLDWAKLGIKKEPLWSYQCNQSVAIAVCGNAVVVAENLSDDSQESKVAALNLENGSLLWSHGLPSPAVSWGLAVDCNGRVVVTLEDGSVLCFGRDRGA